MKQWGSGDNRQPTVSLSQQVSDPRPVHWLLTSLWLRACSAPPCIGGPGTAAGSVRPFRVRSHPSWSSSPGHMPRFTISFAAASHFTPKFCYSTSFRWRVQKLLSSLLVTHGLSDFCKPLCVVKGQPMTISEVLLQPATPGHSAPLTCYAAFSHYLIEKAAGPESCYKVNIQLTFS